MKKKMKMGTILAFAVLGMILLMSILAPLIAPYDPLKIDMANALEGPSREHLLGTDNIGRDLLSRVIYGGRQSMVLAAVATSLSLALGCLIGMVAGYFGGWVDLVITSISNIFRGFPA